MTTNHEFEKRLGGWLQEDSAQRVPDHLTEVLVRTVATRQRRSWSSLRRWLPMDVTVPPAPFARAGSWRPILILLVALLIAALVVLAVGSPRRLPPPFGLARNGATVTAINGDLLAVDPKTGKTAPLISDDPKSFDFGPMFSRDGTKLLFLRSVLGKGLELVVANPDGSGSRVVSPPVDGLDQSDWSPDGSRIVFLSHVPGTAGHTINIVNADGSGLRPIPLKFPANGISWLAPNGDEIVFRGEHLIDHNPPPAIWAVHPDGSGLRSLTTRPAADKNDYQDVSGSPDGTRILYRESVLKDHMQIHVVDLQTGEDRVLPAPGDEPSQTGPTFSPDGVRLVYLRFLHEVPDQGTAFHLVVAPLDGSTTGVELPLRGTLGSDGPTINNYFFTPDGTAVVANELTSRVEWLLPIDGSPGTVLAHGVAAYDALSTVQRLAP